MGNSGIGRVEKATRAELRELGVSVQTSATAALAVSIAWQIDRARGAVAAAAAAAQHRLLMDDLRAKVAASRPAKDGIDDLRARRQAREAAG